MDIIENIIIIIVVSIIIFIIIFIGKVIINYWFEIDKRNQYDEIKIKLLEKNNRIQK